MIDSVFLICAVLGGGVFVLRTGMQLVGFGAGEEIDGAEGDGPDMHPDADSGFRVLSLQGMSAFLMMFGLVGLALVRESGVGPLPALAASAVAAMGAVWVIGKIFTTMARLQSSGTMKVARAVGQEGVVYLTIAQGGIGKVQVEVQGRLGVWDARCSDNSVIATGKRVRVVSVTSGELLVVEAI